jgi:hypothetical protein
MCVKKIIIRQNVCFIFIIINLFKSLIIEMI